MMPNFKFLHQPTKNKAFLPKLIPKYTVLEKTWPLILHNKQTSKPKEKAKRNKIYVRLFLLLTYFSSKILNYFKLIATRLSRSR